MGKMDGVIPLAMEAGLSASVASLGTGFTVKGVVTKADLPSTGSLGDLYLVSDEGYASYVWDGTQFVAKVNDVATAADLQEALYS